MTNQEAIETIKANYPPENYSMLRKALDIALALLKEQEPKIGHWIFGNSAGSSWMKCSNCCVSQSGQTGCWSYCPNCGAEMNEQVKYDEFEK